MTDVGRDIHADEFTPEVVARSKDVAATATEELKDYHRWLKDFVASEEKNRKRHTSALKREQARYHRQLKRERADSFDLKRFHEQLLSYGSAPVRVIRELMLERA